MKVNNFKKTRTLSLLAALLATIFIVGACATADDTPPAAGTAGTTPAGDAAAANGTAPAPAAGEVVFAVMSDAPTLDFNAAGGNNSATADVRNNITEGLVRFSPGPTPQVVPVLATSWEIPDPYTYIFNLRQGVTFHDGSPFNADAAKLSLDRVLDPEVASPVAFLLDMIDEITVIDNYTLQITLLFPYAPFMNHLAHGAAHIVAPATIEEANAGGRTVSENIIGTGPFILDQWVSGDYIRLVPNPNHWETVPVVDVIFRVVPDPQTRMAMLDAGEAHVIFLQGGQYLQMNHLNHVDFIHFGSAVFSYISFNTASDGPLGNPAVRRAISMAVDIESIFYGIAEGFGSMATDGPLPPLVNHAPSGITMPQFDPAAAQQLLIDLGYGDGFDIDLVINEGNAARAQTAELLQAELLPMNINVNIRVLEWGAFLDDIDAGNYDMATQAWGVITADPDYAFDPLFHSRNHPPYGNNSTFFTNARVDYLLEAARLELDPANRAAMYHEVAEILQEEMPAVFTTFGHSIFGVNGIDGIEFNFNSDPFFSGVTLR